MPVVDDSIEIERPREEVYDSATDPELIRMASSNLIEYEHEGPLAEGMTIRGVVKVAGKKFEWTSQVVEHDPPNAFEHHSVESAFPFTYRLTFEETDGGTTIHWHQESESFGGFFGKLADPLVTKMYAKDVRANLERMKELIEGEAQE